LPFVLLGSFLLVIGVVCLFILPKIEELPEDIEKKGILKVFKIPGVFVCAIGIATSSISIGFISATLEPHIRQFNLSNFFVGLIFICNGGFYAISSPFWGFLVDKKFKPKLLAFFGAMFILVGFLIVGPVSFLPFEPTVATVVIGLVLQGIGCGGILITSFADALQTSIKLIFF
jgi:MFS family permease